MASRAGSKIEKKSYRYRYWVIGMVAKILEDFYIYPRKMKKAKNSSPRPGQNYRPPYNDFYNP